MSKSDFVFCYLPISDLTGIKPWLHVSSKGICTSMHIPVSAQQARYAGGSREVKQIMNWNHSSGNIQTAL
jgi:hypothetical protein